MSNPFGNQGDHSDQPPPNPYASPQEVGPSPVPVQNRPYLRPHRGPVILVLGILGLFTGLAGMVCCVLFALGSLGLSLPAWIMARHDLQAIDAGVMDPTGRGITLAGMILAIIGTVIVGLAVVLMVAGFVFFLVMEQL